MRQRKQRLRSIYPHRKSGTFSVRSPLSRELETAATWRALLEDWPFGLAVVHGPEHRITYVNAALCALTGGDPAAAIGSPLGEAFRRLDAFCPSMLRHVYETGAGEIAVDRELRSGDELSYVRCFIWPVKVDNDVRGAVLVLVDTTEETKLRYELARMAEKLDIVTDSLLQSGAREREHTRRTVRHAAQLAALLDSLSEGVVLADAKGVLMTNPAGMAILGSAAWPFHGGPKAGEVVLSSPDGAPLAPEQYPLARALRGEHFVDEEVVAVVSGGRTVHLLTSGSSAPSDENDTMAMVVFRDVTALKRDERARAEVLERAERLRVVGQMAGGIAHDMGNLLNPVGLHVALLGRALEKGNIAGAKEAGAQIQHVNERATETLARLRDFLREAPLKVAPTQPDHLVEEAVQIARPRASALHKRVQWRWELSAPPLIAAEPTDIIRALVNLVINSIDALSSGGTITLRSGAEEHGSWIDVIDDGPGIPPELKERVFDPFFSTKGDEGSGLGLAMVRACVERHGGRVTLTTEPGKGTQFRLWFPWAHPGD